MDKNIGALLDGRYEIQKRIGVGGMADVYRALDVEEGREVAVKILKNEFINNDEFLMRFKNESKAVSMLSHPNIVRVFDVGFNEDVRFIVMEYIDGITLRDYLDREKVLSWKEASHLVIQILRALQHAHDRGIIHRDIKPQNIMMFEDGTIKVMDFGIAKFTYELGITATAQTIGSVHYISPEQACGKPTDGKSDIYSVGILLYEMLSGKKPFDTDNPLTVALMQMNDIAENPRKLNPDIPKGMEEIILKAMEKDASARYHSANDMIKDIELFKNDPSLEFGYVFNEAFSENDKASSEAPETEAVSDAEITDSEDLEEDAPQNYYIGGRKKHEPALVAADIEYETPANPLFVKLATIGTIIGMVLLIAVIAGVVSRIVKNKGDTTFAMPSLLQYDYDDMVDMYSGKLLIKVDGEPVYSEYVENTIVSQSVDEGTVVQKGTEVLVKVSNGKNKSIVPEVDGMSSGEAIELINDAGFKVVQTDIFNDTVAYGKVIRVSPEAGTEMEISNSVTIYVSKGAQNDAKILPNVVGMQKDTAVETLKNAGFTVVVESKDDKAPEGEVVSQNFPGETLVNPTEKIIIYVSTGKPPVSEVPLTINFPEKVRGVMTFKVYMDDKLIQMKEYINIEGLTQYRFEVQGSDKHTVKIEIHNTADNKTAVVGTYSFDFEQKKYEVITEDINAALKAVGGIVPEETTTSAVTTTVVTTPAPTEPPVVTTIPPTEPPVTEPPVVVTPAPEQPTETEPPATDPAPVDSSEPQSEQPAETELLTDAVSE